MSDRAGTEPERQWMTSFAAAVRARREAIGLRQEEVADLAGCSERFVHTVEQGKPTLRLDKVLDVLEVLGLDLTVTPGGGSIGPPATPAGAAGREHAAP